ncbi:MAG: glycogen debranching protein, partial [Verrucomicrobia bacterium]|nr:glycogen debranching protein [Verrucomicrobiota bacterium]
MPLASSSTTAAKTRAGRRAPVGAVRSSRYSARDGAIVGGNQPRFFNRPIYLANTNAFVLAGDRPVIRFASGETLHGTLWFGFMHGATSSWLHTWHDITMEYRAGHVCWIARRSGVHVTLDVVGMENEVGFAVRATIAGGRRGDKLCWSFGGARDFPGRHLNWDLDPYCDPPQLPTWFDPALCEKNAARVSAKTFALSSKISAPIATVGECDGSRAVLLRDAAGNSNPAALFAAQAKGRPVVCGSIDVSRTATAHWEFRRVVRSKTKSTALAAAAAFAAGMARALALQRVIEIDTPDARLNAAVSTLPAAIDGSWYPPTFRHGAMLWNVPYLGWRTACGATALGWHDRVKAHAEYYLGHQEKKSVRRSMDADPKVMLTIPAPGSRFYGRGRVTQDQGIYNMQSQLFDQLIHAWHWTGDAGLERRLRPALELHLEWLHACFDPDDDGLFESVINVWPTDSVWYAGGGATEETSYAYRAHQAARLLAERAGDRSAVLRHSRQAARIRRAFRQKL